MLKLLAMKTSFNTLCLTLISFSLFAQTELFRDDFYDNGNAWGLGVYDYGETAIENGKLILSHTTESGSNWSNVGVYFDPEEDFEIESSQRQITGEDNYSTGLVYGISDSENFYTFSVTSTQYFKLEKCVAGKYESMIPWTYLPAVINAEGQTNKLLLKKIGSNVKLYINDKYVGTKAFEPFFGQKFGFWVQRNTVEYDYLVIRSGTTTVTNTVSQVKQQTTTSFYSDVDQSIPISKSRNDDAIAVVIGNTDYVKAKKVNFAVNDSRSMKNYLMKTMGFREGNILHVENATKGDFELLFGTKTNAHSKLANTIRPGLSDVFVFYSGHGAPGLNDKQGYFVPVECDPNYVELSGYPTDVFYQNLGKLGARSVTVVLDACFSGATVFENISPLVIKAKPETVSADIMVLSSSSGSEVSSWYNDQSHGMFTYFFLKAFQEREKADTNRDKRLTLNEIYQFVADNNYGVPYWSRRIHGIEQHPALSGNVTDQVMVEF